MERIIVNLTPRASGALAGSVQLTGYTKTDIINRALSVYEYIESVRAKGGRLLVDIPDDPILTELMIF